jgi:ribonuclease D
MFVRIDVDVPLAFPVQLRRVLTSNEIVKVGVGLVNDISVVWNDLRIDLNNLVDVGLMARLLLAEKYAAGAYQNLSMDVAVREIMGCKLDKAEQLSDWSTDLTASQLRCWYFILFPAVLSLIEV